MATLYSWIVMDMANKIKKESMPEVKRCADSYERNLGIDAVKLLEAARDMAAAQ